MICLENVFFKYPGAEVAVINGLSAVFSPGEAVAVTGKNGSGKTTLTRLLTGVLRPASGRILIDGDDAAKMDLFDIGRRAGCLFQDPARQLFCRTVLAEAAFGPKSMGLSQGEAEDRARRYIALLGLSDREEAFPGTLSGGEKKRAALAAVLAMEPRYLVLDEPETGLDLPLRESLAALLSTLRAGGTGIVFTSHSAAFVSALADRKLVLE